MALMSSGKGLDLADVVRGCLSYQAQQLLLSWRMAEEIEACWGGHRWCWLRLLLTATAPSEATLSSGASLSPRGLCFRRLK